MEKEEIDIGYKRNENKKCDCITTLYACFVIIAVVAIIIMVASIGSLGDTPKVMGLVGILATFVVISNYAQMVEIRKKTEDYIHESQREMNIMNQKINALAKGYGVDEIAIMELVDFDYKKLEIVQFEKRYPGNYYVVYKDDKKPMFVHVFGTKDNKKATVFSPKEYLSQIIDEDVRNEKKNKLLTGGFSKEELE